jgi:hypothetical protein
MRIGCFRMAILLEHKTTWKQMAKIKNVMKVDNFHFAVPHTKCDESKKQKLAEGTNDNNNGVGEETGTEMENFKENGGFSRDNNRRKIKSQ